MLSPAAYISFGMAGMLSGDGKCKTFDKRANGYVRGEGCGAVFLKPLGGRRGRWESHLRGHQGDGGKSRRARDGADGAEFIRANGTPDRGV